MDHLPAVAVGQRADLTMAGREVALLNQGKRDRTVEQVEQEQTGEAKAATAGLILQLVAAGVVAIKEAVAVAAVGVTK